MRYRQFVRSEQLTPLLTGDSVRTIEVVGHRCYVVADLERNDGIESTIRSLHKLRDI